VKYLALALGLLAGCTGASVNRRVDPQLAQLRGMGYRVAVIPFVVSAPEEGFLTGSLGAVGELLSLEAGSELPMHARIGGILRGDVVAWLQQSQFEVVEPWITDTQLAHSGIAAARLQERGTAGELARLLAVDGIVYGDVTQWNRSYYLVQSVAEAGLRLELVDGGSGKSLFLSERSETIGAGLTGGPTGFVSAATEPLAGLRSSQLRELTRAVARNTVADLNGGSLSEETGPQAPRLSFVTLAQMHDGPFHVGERVEVIAVGTPGCDVRFDLGRLRTGVPMHQVALHPDSRGDRGTYVGHYVVQPGESAKGLPLYCTIRRSSRQAVSSSRYRWEGTVALGDVVAEPVSAPVSQGRGSRSGPRGSLF
jgi:hypothetical protein